MKPIEQNAADTAAARGKSHFRAGLYCAESVLLAAAEAFQIQNDLIPRIATGFCSGVARTGGLCGAVSGAILAVGMLRGRNRSTDKVDDSYRLVRRIARGFEERFGSTNCFQLTGCRLDTPEGQALFKEKKMGDQCARFTAEAARLTVAALQDDLRSAGGENP